MKVLVACEFSGIVRDAFLARGHDAWSCDLLPTEKEGPHIQDDVLKHLDDGWDLMIAHPPCTHLSVSGARYFDLKRKDGRQDEAIDFFMALVRAKILKKCVENPISIMSTLWRKPDQIIQPWQFGHPESKATCLWLEWLPLLAPTNILSNREIWENQTKDGQNKLMVDGKWIGFNDPRTSHLRSRTYQGIAQAMAEQWG